MLLAPGMGDGIQAAKAGILEIGDVFVVNKADRDGADQVARDLRYMQSLGGRHAGAGAWRPPIVQDRRRARARASTRWSRRSTSTASWLERARRAARRRRAARAATEIEAIALGEVRDRLVQVHGSAALDAAAARVVAGDTDPYTAADELVAGLAAAPLG